MSAQTIRNQLQANADASGNAVMRLSGNYELNHQGAYRVFVQLQGNLNAVVTILLDGIPVDGGLTTNKQFKAGPVFVQAASRLSITVTGMQPLQTCSAYLDGIVSDNISDFAALGGPGYGGGSVQNDPSQLLTAQLGPPLVENQTYSVPGSGTHSFFVGDFVVSGYGALMLFGKCPNPAAAVALYAVLLWEDAFGNVISTSQIDCLSPEFICFFGVQGQRVSIILGNTSGGAVNVNSVTAVPLTSMPADPGRFVPQAFAAPVNFQIASTPPANMIINFNASVAAATTQVITGNFVWYGEAFFTVSPVTNGAGGVSTWWAQLTSTDASGNVTFVDVITGQNVGGANGPRQIWMPSGTPTVNFRNLGAGAITPVINLIAA
jgi:hypothetical protein